MDFKFDSDACENLTKGWILARITETDIFEFYLRIRVQFQEKFRSPLRKDLTPTCNFTTKGGRLRFRDWSSPHTQDCFDIVQMIHGCNYNTALEIIAKDFKLKDRSVIYTPSLRPRDRIDGKPTPREYKKIQIKRRSFDKYDAKYLSAFGITLDICKRFKVVPLSRVWMEGKGIWSHTPSDPALGYYFGVDPDGFEHWKIYFWKRRKGVRFMSNTTRIQGARQLVKEGSLLVLTKSLKDVMVLYSMGIDSVAFQSESVALDEDSMVDYALRFSRIVTLYDFDRAGVFGAAAIRRLYNIPARFLTNGRFRTKDYGAKDVSDLVKRVGLEEAKRLILNLLR